MRANLLPLSRRAFIGRLGAGLAVAGVGGTLPAWSASPASPRATRATLAREPRVLVFIQLRGGLDPCEVLVPVGDERYLRGRPTLALSPRECLPLNDAVALSHACASWESALKDGTAVILPQVETGAAELSHFRSTELLQTASPAGEVWSSGWLERAARACEPRRTEPVLHLAADRGGGRSALAEIATRAGATGSDEFYRVGVEGFDTHFGQVEARAGILRPFATALQQFQAQLKQRGVSHRVLTLVTSEFGRTLVENDQGGTDHAAGGLLMLCGENLRPRPLAASPAAAPVALRSVYAGVLRDWLHVAPAAVLRAAVPPLELFSAAAFA
jgi:uncharacterized protein (DUF1501 family)